MAKLWHHTSWNQITRIASQFLRQGLSIAIFSRNLFNWIDSNVFLADSFNDMHILAENIRLSPAAQIVADRPSRSSCVAPSADQRWGDIKFSFTMLSHVVAGRPLGRFQSRRGFLNASAKAP